MIEIVRRVTQLEKQAERNKALEKTVISNKTPASATASGVKGEIAWDSSYIYVCVATDTWKRVGISTW